MLPCSLVGNHFLSYTGSLVKQSEARSCLCHVYFRPRLPVSPRFSAGTNWRTLMAVEPMVSGRDVHVHPAWHWDYIQDFVTRSAVHQPGQGHQERLGPEPVQSYHWDTQTFLPKSPHPFLLFKITSRALISFNVLSFQWLSLCLFSKDASPLFFRHGLWFQEE